MSEHPSSSTRERDVPAAPRRAEAEEAGLRRLEGALESARKSAAAGSVDPVAREAEMERIRELEELVAAERARRAL